tara:strand:+ start:40 stop:186 length:147 start_codon:yes stop_codon:yes gene_type:complete
LIVASGVEHDLEGVNDRQSLLTSIESFVLGMKLLIEISGFLDSSHVLV